MFTQILEGLRKIFGVEPGPTDKRASESSSSLPDSDLKQQPPLPEVQKTEIDDPLATLKAMTAEDICGLREGMTYDELDTLLKMLYRRHNRAASSLNDTKRAEADIVLDAIVEIRQRYLEEREK